MAAKGLHAISRKVEPPLQIIWCAGQPWSALAFRDCGRLAWLLSHHGINVRDATVACDANIVLRCREELEYVANTLIFVLSGVIIAGKIWQSSASGTHYIQAADYGYAVLLWLYLLVWHRPGPQPLAAAALQAGQGALCYLDGRAGRCR
jgi:hypothetical protein